jgi:exonuclease VII large subunit
LGFEDETEEPMDAVEAANLYAENKRKEADQRQAETLAQMEKNQEDFKKKQQQLGQLSEILGINEMRHKIDQQDQSINYLASRMDEMILTLNKFMTPQEPQIPNPTTANSMMDANSKFQLIQQIAPGLLEKLLDRIFPAQTAGPAPLISQDVINEKMTKAFYDDLETGESIRQFISDALKKKATKTIVNQSLSNIGVASNHEPE